MARLSLPAALDSIPAFHELVRRAVRELDPEAETGMLEMALEELLVNVASYAYPDGSGQVELACEPGGRGLDLILTDTGVPYDPTASETPDLNLGVEDRPIGGLGLFLAGKVFSSMRYSRHGEANVLALRFDLPPAKTSQPAGDAP